MKYILKLRLILVCCFVISESQYPARNRDLEK